MGYHEIEAAALAMKRTDRRRLMAALRESNRRYAPPPDFPERVEALKAASMRIWSLDRWRTGKGQFKPEESLCRAFVIHKMLRSGIPWRRIAIALHISERAIQLDKRRMDKIVRFPNLEAETFDKYQQFINSTATIL